MSEIKLYIATSLDGYIAREDGSIDWLDAVPNPDQIDHGYAEFYETIDTVILGRKTYEVILGFGVDWPYPDCKTYIVTSDSDYQVKTENTEVLNEVSREQVDLIKRHSQKNIWIMGGGKLITTFLNLGEVDEMILSVIPTILGKGIRLFPDSPRETSFKIINVQAFETGAINLAYRKNTLKTTSKPKSNLQD